MERQVGERCKHVGWVKALVSLGSKTDEHSTYRFLRATPFQESKAQVTTGSQNFSAVFSLLDFLGAEGHFFLAVLQACCCHFAQSCSAVCAGNQKQQQQHRIRSRFAAPLSRPRDLAQLWTRTHVRTFLTLSPWLDLVTFSWTVFIGKTQNARIAVRNNGTKLSQETAKVWGLGF